MNILTEDSTAIYSLSDCYQITVVGDALVADFENRASLVLGRYDNEGMAIMALRSLAQALEVLNVVPMEEVRNQIMMAINAEEGII